MMVYMMNAFDIKSTKIDVLSISLHTSDLFDLEDVLVKLGKKFQESGVVPFVLDVQEFDYPESLDLAALVSLFSKYGMQILGLRHSNEQWAAVAAKYHLLFCPSHSENTKGQGQVEVQKTANNQNQRARKTVLITTSVRTGQQVYAEDGDLIVTGAVSQGAELIADGNIHIYAPMRGRALAGAKGDTSARIFIHSMQAELVSVAGIYRNFEQDLPDHLHKQPVQILLQDSRLVISAIGSE
ncbi:TPA: septum site-determining protein MinC [Neisseria lactamica]|uniref:septum site-determining protein MinC n=1 Tax=Neisseria lactamica TaxID=486 RepID=UPI0004958EC8|nr:septum site-determining protein MinC [Neisseria lactamica]